MVLTAFVAGSIRASVPSASATQAAPAPTAIRRGRYILKLSAKDAAGNAGSARLRFRVKR